MWHYHLFLFFIGWFRVVRFWRHVDRNWSRFILINGWRCCRRRILNVVWRSVVLNDVKWWSVDDIDRSVVDLLLRNWANTRLVKALVTRDASNCDTLYQGSQTQSVLWAAWDKSKVWQAALKNEEIFFELISNVFEKIEKLAKYFF